MSDPQYFLKRSPPSHDLDKTVLHHGAIPEPIHVVKTLVLIKDRMDFGGERRNFSDNHSSAITAAVAERAADSPSGCLLHIRQFLKNAVNIMASGEFFGKHAFLGASRTKSAHEPLSHNADDCRFKQKHFA